MATHKRYAGELLEDRGMRVIHRPFPAILISAALSRSASASRSPARSTAA